MSKNFTHQQQGGQIAMGTAVFFLLISTTIVLSMASSVYREVKNVREFVGTRESYYLSEALNEDLVYRVKNLVAYPSAPSIATLELNNYIATGTVVAIDDSREIVTTGERRQSFRRVKTVLTQSPSGVSFNYGTQSGNGGFTMSNNSGVIGNVYSNGNIVGANGAYITGTAIAANSIGLTADQVNDSPITPPNSIVFGNANSTQDIAQSFQTSTTSPISKVQVYIKKTSTPNNATIRIVTDNAGAPSSNVISSGTLTASVVTTSYAWVEVPLSPTVQVIAGTPYWIIIDAGTNSSRYYTIGANTTYVNGSANIGQYSTTWNNTTPSGLDTYMKIYLGGVVASISDTRVGSSTALVGDVWAHTVTGSTVYGSLYCQTGSGNNKACNTSRPDPTPIGLPLSDDMFTQWKADAAATTTVGNYTVNGSVSLGPRTITGNLTVNGTLTVTGTIYVQGNIVLSNGASVKLATSYGARTGIVLTDGTVSISNNASFAGSGQTGSYMLVVTTSDCPLSASCSGANAIEVSNNAGTVILNAQRGTVHVSNNAGAKEITAYKIEMDNNATVTYESGLANVNFTSGPTGGFDITLWQEVE